MGVQPRSSLLATQNWTESRQPIESLSGAEKPIGSIRGQVREASPSFQSGLLSIGCGRISGSQPIWIFTVTVRPRQFAFSHQAQTSSDIGSPPLRSERDRSDPPRRSSPSPKTFVLGQIEPDDRLGHARSQITSGRLCRTELCRHTSSGDNADVSYFNAIWMGGSFGTVHVI
jgi:hypothetical protein